MEESPLSESLAAPHSGASPDRAAADAMTSAERYRLPVTVEDLDALMILAVDRHLVFPRMGYVAGLYQDVLLGWRNLDGAMQVLARDGTAENIPVLYCLRLGVVAVLLITQGRPSDAVILSRLLLVTTSRVYGENSEVWVQAAAVFIQAVSALGPPRASNEMREALSTADRLVGNAHKLAEPGHPGQLPSALSAVGQLWHSLALNDESETGDDALRRSRDLLREAAGLATRPESGRIHATLAQVLFTLHGRGTDSSIEALEAARTAMMQIDRQSQPLDWYVAQRIANKIAPGQNQRDRVTLDDIVAMREVAGKRAASEFVGMEARDLADCDRREEAAMLLHEAWDPLDVRETVDQRTRLALLSTAVHTFDGKWVPCRDIDELEAAQIFEASASLPLEQELATRMHLALHAPQVSDAAVWPIREAGPLVAGLQSSPLRDALTLGLALSHGSHAAHSPMVVPVVGFHLEMLTVRFFTELRLREMARGALATALQRLHTWSPRPYTLRDKADSREARDELDVILETCLRDAANLETLLGDKFREWLLEAGRLLSPAARLSPISTVTSAVAHSVAFKGATTTRLLRDSGPWEESDDARTVRRQIAQVEAVEPPAVRSDMTQEDLNEEIRRCAWLRTSERLSGDAGSQSRRNLQSDYDDMLLRKVVAARPASGPGLHELTPDRLFDWLGPGTLLVDLFLGRDPGGRYTCYSPLLSGDARFQFYGYPDQEEIATFADPSDETRHVTIDGVAQIVAHVRHLVQEPSGARPLSRNAASALEAAAGSVLRFPEGTLGDLRGKGYDHMVVCPHGPLAFLPIHLLPVDGTTLADNWTVSTVPTLGTLRPGSASAEVTRSNEQRALIASPDGGAAYGLSSQPRLWQQVSSLQALSGQSEALPLGEATPQAAIELLERCRYGHIAAHGAALDQVPAYHCLYLDPPGKDASEGRLFAHQVLRADLRRVDLVTLCACETAIGRADQSGNVRGLPLAFLAAGAATVVATLWPVVADAALDFFLRLHSELDTGLGKLAAFRTAQIACRERFPNFADWGAFVYIGAWR